LCLKVASAGYRIVWTPGSVAEHRESQSRGSDFEPEHQRRFLAETRVMQARWGDALRNDRFYHRHFSRTGGLFVDLGAPEVSFATMAT
jgi:GT2 family glycosyltransferase